MARFLAREITELLYDLYATDIVTGTWSEWG